jgi:hypothetical protein
MYYYLSFQFECLGVPAFATWDFGVRSSGFQHLRNDIRIETSQAYAWKFNVIFLKISIKKSFICLVVFHVEKAQISAS